MSPDQKKKALLGQIPAAQPFKVVSIDFLHLDNCAENFEYISVVCDHFTRFAQCYATRRNSARAAANKLFNDFILQWGFPTRIHHDRGAEWNNHLFKHLHQLTGIKASNTTPYHPMGDPVVERYNRTLINMLKAIPENEKKRWKNHLPKLTFAYNSTVHKATGFTPFYLLMGRESRLRIDGVFPDFGESGKTGTMTYGNFVTDWRKRMSEAFELANQRSDRAKQYHKAKYDNKVRGLEIGVGDRVLLQTCVKEGTGKLQSFWQPEVYVVVSKRSHIPVYEIRKYGVPNAKVKVVHRNLLKCVNELAPPEEVDGVGDKRKVIRAVPNKGKKGKPPGGEVSHTQGPDVQEVVDQNCSSESEDDGYLVVRRGTCTDPIVLEPNPATNVEGDQERIVVPEVEILEGQEEVGEEEEPGSNWDNSGDSSEDSEAGRDTQEDGEVSSGSQGEASVLEDTIEAEPDVTTDESRYESTVDVLSEEIDSDDYNSASESPPPERPTVPSRRPSRTIKPPTVFTYDKLGKPSRYQQSSASSRR